MWVDMLSRKLALALALVTLVGCAAAPTEDVDGAASALSDGASSAEAATVVRGVTSSNPELTGVDEWRLTVVREGGGEKVAAVGLKDDEEVLDVIVLNGDDGEPSVRIHSKRDREVDDELRAALATDLGRLQAELPEDPPESSDESTIRTQGLGGTPDCAGARWRHRISSGMLILTGALAVGGCAAAVASGGGAAVLCAGGVYMTLLNLETRTNAASELKRCAAQRKK